MQEKCYIDNAGRIVLPEILLEKSGLKENDSLEILVNKRNILLKINKDACIICDSRINTVEYKGKKICKKCIKNI